MKCIVSLILLTLVAYCAGQTLHRVQSEFPNGIKWEISSDSLARHKVGVVAANPHKPHQTGTTRKQQILPTVYKAQPGILSVQKKQQTPAMLHKKEHGGRNIHRKQQTMVEQQAKPQTTRGFVRPKAIPLLPRQKTVSGMPMQGSLVRKLPSYHYQTVRH